MVSNSATLKAGGLFMISDSVALKKLNTFAIEAKANFIAIAKNEKELLKLWRYGNEKHQPVLILGRGSNVLFMEDFAGMLLLNRIKGINITEDNKAWHLHVGAGEIWQDLVVYTLNRKIPGLENLALIPGCVGSAPIQNIGAYGVELKQLCEYVDILNLESGKKHRLSSSDCQFGYRESIFKHRFRVLYAIVAVGLRLIKTWKPVLNYGDLARLNSINITAKEIFDVVCAMRKSKLPDPDIIGNAGSFFKNPVISAKAAQSLLSISPYAPHYPQPNGDVKLAAGWLIDQCHLRGYRLGGAGVHDKQALIPINHGQATGEDIVALAREVRWKVADKFSVWLEPEVRFIAAHGEVDAVGSLI